MIVDWLDIVEEDKVGLILLVARLYMAESECNWIVLHSIEKNVSESHHLNSIFS